MTSDPGAMPGFLLFESTPGLHLAVRPDAPVFTVVAASNDYIRENGRNRTGVVNRSVREVFEDQGAVDSIQTAMETRKSQQTASATVTPVLDDEGEVAYLILTVAGQSLHPSNITEQRLRGVLDSLFAFVGVMTPDGVLLEANQAPLEAAGISKEDVIGKRFEDTYWWSYSKEVQDQLRQAIALARQGIASRYDVDVRMRGGTLLTIDFMLAPLKDASGRIEYVIPSAVDVHDRKRTELALRQSEERLRMAQEVARICSWFMDLETGELSWGPDVYEFYDFPPEAPATYETWKAVVLEEDLPAAESAIAATLNDNAALESEFRIRRKGEVRWVLAKAQVVKDERSGHRRFVGVNIDITDRKRAEERLAKQLDLTKAITDNATTALFIMDERQHCVFLNPAAEALTGFTLPELQGEPLHNFVHHKHPDGTPYPLEECPIDRAFPQRNQESGEDVFVHKDGTFYPVAFTASPIREGHGLVGTVVEVQNIAERKRMEEALRENEERFRTLADHISQFAWMADRTGYIFWYNRRWYDYTGTNFEQMQGWGWRAVHHPDHVERVTERFRAHIESGEPWEDTFPLRGKDGQYRWFLSRALPICDENGAVVRWFGTNTDINEQKRVEEQLRRANQDLEQFAYSASHDLQEPLRNVAIYSQLLKRRYTGQLDQQADEFLDVLVEGAQRMRLLVADLLTYTEIGGPDDDAPGPADAETALKQTLMTLDPTIKELCAVVTHDPLLKVGVKPLHLEQLLVNLIGNAVKYRKDGEPPRVHVSAAPQGDYVCFSIRDNGIGIDPQFHQRVFGVFKRLHPRGGKYPGTGIGLAICKKITNRYGGTIWVESQEGEGATFRFTVPAAQQ